MSVDIDVKDQVRLSLGKCAKIVISGIKHRLLRSTLTMSVILLAVAFFMAMLTESVFVRATSQALNQELTLRKASAEKLKVMFVSSTLLQTRNDLAEFGDSKINDYCRMLEWKSEDLLQLAEQSHRVQVYLRFFSKLDIGKKLSLVGKKEDMEIFSTLVSNEKWQLFLKNMAPMYSVKIPGNVSEFRGFLDRLAVFKSSLQKYHQALELHLQNFKNQLLLTIPGASDYETWIRLANDKELDQLVDILKKFRFPYGKTDLLQIQKDLKIHYIQRSIQKKLMSPSGRQEWNRIFRSKHTLEEKLGLLDDPRALKVLTDFEPMDVLSIAQKIKEERYFANVTKALSGKTETNGDGLLSQRQIFLLAISFIVCMVGISNAMLMSITERFREIATMKCLGATDGFILTQFLIEATIQGVAGGCIGMLIGLILAFIKNYLVFGNIMFQELEFASIFYTMGSSFVAGIILSMLASLYPSWSASRMAPMEAMRVE